MNCYKCGKKFNPNEKPALTRTVEVQVTLVKPVDKRNPTYIRQLHYCEKCKNFSDDVQQ